MQTSSPLMKEQGTGGKEADSWIVNILRIHPRDEQLDQDV
jgi:hypothetical protein